MLAFIDWLIIAGYFAAVFLLGILWKGADARGAMAFLWYAFS